MAQTSLAELQSKLGLLRLPPGFKIEVFATGIEGARGLAHGPDGTVLVGSTEGTISMIRDGKVTTLVKGLKLPIGVDFKDGSLFTASIDRVLRYDGVTAATTRLGSPKVIVGGLPRSAHHGGRYLRIGPDGRVYYAVGVPCNICEPAAGVGTILSANRDGGDRQTIASGIRNSVGFDWQPGTNALWFTDNGRDLLGDDSPPDELNRVSKPGLSFGYPYCHGGDISDPDFGKGHSCSQFEAPVQKLGPHVASLGMRFYNGELFPADYRGDAFIAEHGSWNRSHKVGYRITRVKVRGDRALSYEPFIQGWLQGEEPWGRPVDLLNMPDGSLLISDDMNGAIYRVRYESKR